MSIYSNSKIEMFEQCRLKFKYKYIDKITPEIKKSIEALLGDVVHKTLEWLYLQVLENIIPSLDNLISFYSEKWQENYSKEMPIFNKSLTEKDYFNKGVEFLVSYYLKQHPFQDNTIATEKKVEIDLDETGNKKVIGYIDRLAHNIENNEIEVHDYKTSNTVIMKEKIENSRQLSIYSLAIKDMFGKDKHVCMIWHFLAHDIKVCLRKTNEELEMLKKELIDIINLIEGTKEFPPTKSKLCDWCEYKNICEGWR